MGSTNKLNINSDWCPETMTNSDYMVSGIQPTKILNTMKLFLINNAGNKIFWSSPICINVAYIKHVLWLN